MPAGSTHAAAAALSAGIVTRPGDAVVPRPVTAWYGTASRAFSSDQPSGSGLPGSCAVSTAGVPGRAARRSASSAELPPRQGGEPVLQALTER